MNQYRLFIMTRQNYLSESDGNCFEPIVVWNFLSCTSVDGLMRDAVAQWLVRSSPERAVRVRALAGDIVLCSWARHLTLTVPLSTQEYKWVPANC